MSNEPNLDDEWHAERLARRIAAVRNARPARLQVQGDLDPRIEQWIRDVLAGGTANLVMIGDVGRTKTWSAWEALERLTVAGWIGSWKFATSADWHDAIAPPVDREMLRVMRTLDLLILDDLGSARVNDWERECLFGVIDERWQHARPTVITSNVRKLTETLGERLTSRLRDGATTLILEGEDRRGGR
ncbi:ATP-binding protein [Planomonospora sp. ID67723]|uniref:ATP-binding protein n=1 Tax=Planomonospora sp. ID67723 TaxID=2738134 RepID=UPI0018C3C7E2|nr:ATP-binding protein [Planomonospora sp. ID67723]MBG0828517.1 ATP-binding protein [Planomonospora sp. ID67723]